MFFRLSSWELAGILLAIVAGVTIGGVVLGRYMREHSETLKEPFGVMQAALLGLATSRRCACLRSTTVCPAL